MAKLRILSRWWSNCLHYVVLAVGLTVALLGYKRLGWTIIGAGMVVNLAYAVPLVRAVRRLRRQRRGQQAAAEAARAARWARRSS